MLISDINTTTWLNNNQVSVSTRSKNKIVLGDTYLSIDEYFNKILNRFDGKYDKSSHFTIDRNGNIYQHFSLNYYSNYTNFNNVDNRSVFISLENINSVEVINYSDNNHTFIDWRGRVVREDVYHKCWRNNDYWIYYTKKQIAKLKELLTYLCEEMNINKQFINTNTKIKRAFNYEGIVVRSNFSQYYYDVNPSFNFSEIKSLNEKVNG